MKKLEFLQDVRHEIDMLKKHATEKELAKLDFDTLDYDTAKQCIYGQITGSCGSKRAKVLMDKSCIRVMDLKRYEDEGGAGTLAGMTFSSISRFINGENTSQGWINEGLNDVHDYGGLSRNYNYLSALEGYICLKGAKNKSIIKYLKGEIKELNL